jgi:hypothetical protein
VRRAGRGLDRIGHEDILTFHRNAVTVIRKWDVNVEVSKFLHDLS